jgi:hypothetical protein
MRTAIALLCTLIPAAALAETPLCGDTKPQHWDLFSPDELKAVLDGKPHGDPVLEEAVAIEAAARSGPIRATPSSKQLTWAQARKMVLVGAVTQIVQSHSKRVELTGRSGTIYVTREPELDAVFKIAAVVDPCHVYIRWITE